MLLRLAALAFASVVSSVAGCAAANGGGDDDAGVGGTECAADGACIAACQAAARAEAEVLSDSGADGVVVSITDNFCREKVCHCALAAGDKCFWKGGVDFETPCPPERAAVEAELAP